MVEENFFIKIDTLKVESDETRVLKLQAIKNELVGSHERKELYFNLGLLEILLPLITVDVDSRVL